MGADWWSGEFNPKNSKPITLKLNTYTPLDVALRWTFPKNGTAKDAEAILYSRLMLSLKPGYLTGVVAREYVRMAKGKTTEDPTGLQDITVTRANTPVFLIKDGALVPNPAFLQPSPVPQWRIWADWSGELERGRSYEWRLRVGPEFASATVVTRYGKAYYR